MSARILLAATLRWPVAARLALAFVRVGCRVDTVCPAEHPVTRMRSLPVAHRYSVLRPVESLQAAINATAPDLIIPCDDDAALHLNLLHKQLVAAGRTQAGDARLIERSLGSPSACALASARGDIAGLAVREGLRVPATRTIGSAPELDLWMAQHDFPMVLKIDHTWGGLGVSIVRSRQDAQRAFRIMAARPALGRTIARATLDRNPSLLLQWMKHPRRSVTAQDYIRGVPANRAVACWRGTVLAGISVEAMNTQHPTGPATVVRVIEHSEMSDAAERLVARLGLSGLWGFDFMIDAASGAAWLIEVNPRATPICHLPLGHGHDLVAALHAQLTDFRVAANAATVDAEVIALFPGEWRRDPESQLLRSAYHDVPWEESELVRDGIGLTWEERGMLARVKARLYPRRLHQADDEFARLRFLQSFRPPPQH